MPTFAHTLRDLDALQTLLARSLHEILVSMSAAWVVSLLVSIPWRWLPSFEVEPQLAMPDRPVEREVERTPLTPPPPERQRAVQLPEELVLRALDSGRTAFVRCWKRALDADPLLEATKVKVRVELDAVGTVVAVTHDATNAKLGNCLSLVTRSLRWAAPMDRAVVEFPLLFRPE